MPVLYQTKYTKTISITEIESVFFVTT